jgi:hypothetical protein
MQISKEIYNKVLEVLEQEIRNADHHLIHNKYQINKLAEDQKLLKKKKKEAYDMMYLVKNKKAKI